MFWCSVPYAIYPMPVWNIPLGTSGHKVSAFARDQNQNGLHVTIPWCHWEVLWDWGAARWLWHTTATLQGQLRKVFLRHFSTQPHHSCSAVFLNLKSVLLTSSQSIQSNNMSDVNTLVNHRAYLKLLERLYCLFWYVLWLYKHQYIGIRHCGLFPDVAIHACFLCWRKYSLDYLSRSCNTSQCHFCPSCHTSASQTLRWKTRTDLAPRSALHLETNLRC